MFRLLLFFCLALLSFGLFGKQSANQSIKPSTKQIAITFDDAPRPATSLGAKKRTQLLIKNLKKVKAPAAMFFATGKHLTEENTPNLLAYAKAGHYIAHHSHRHLWYHKTDVEHYQQDFLQAHQLLKDFPNYQAFYRYPFLDEGRSHEKITAMSRFLQQHGYQEGYVTIDNYDWYLDNLYQKAKQANQIIDETALKHLYVKTLLDAADFYHQIAKKHLGRTPKQVLLLHDNDLAALYIDDLIIELRKQGWEIISPLEAYQDPIAFETPKTLFRGQGRVAALARDKGIPAKNLIHPAEDENFLQQQFETLVSPSSKCSINQLSLLQGQWEYRSAKNIYSEHWQKSPHGFTAKGKVINLKTNRIINSETIDIKKIYSKVIYSSLSSDHETATDFRLASCRNNHFVFINKDNSFPKIIRYQFQAGKTKKHNKLTVRLENLEGKGMTLNYMPLYNR